MVGALPAETERRTTMDGSGFTLPIDRCHALVLNADFRPLSYFPLSLWPWQEAVKAVFLDRVNIVSEYDRKVRSPSFEMRLPSVIALKEYVPTARRPAFTRFNVFLRDRFTCQYCGEDAPAEHLTFDHVVPRSRGGRTTWNNVVTACAGCNLLKGNRLPQESRMFPRDEPAQPIDVPAAGEWARFPAQLSARELARLPLLGYAAGSDLIRRPRMRTANPALKPTPHSIVMVGFRPTIHDFFGIAAPQRRRKTLDGRDEREHDDG